MAVLQRRGLLGAATLAAAAAPAARAQPAAERWPDRPLRLIVPFPGGSTPDLVARTIGGWMSPRLGVPVVVDNRVGAGGNIGTDAIAKATDGHTVGLSINAPTTTAPALYPNLSYDPVRDLAPIAMAVRAPQLLVVRPDLPARDFASFVALARARPGGLSFASVGAGSGGHLAMAEIAGREGLELLHVPYRGFAPAVLDLVAGRVDSMVVTIGAVLPQVRDGQARALASTGERRAAEAPAVPTLAEAGLADATSYGWSGLFAPATMPAAHRERLEALAVEGFRDPAVRAPLEGIGFEVTGLPAEAFRRFLAEETERWGGLVRRLGLRVE